MKVAFYTLGCKLNFSETSAIGRQFSNAGFMPVDFTDTPDYFVINTCSVTEQADKKCRKLVSQAKRINPDAFVAIIGCYAQLKPEEISSIPGVNAVLGAAEKFRLPEVLKEIGPSASGYISNSPIQEVKGFHDAYSVGDRTRAFLKVQDGCDYKCTFCTIPLARGASRSDTLDNVLKNAAQLSASGVQEIVLTGVNLGDYASANGEDFFTLVQALEKQGAVPRYRISSIEPNLLHDEIIDFVAGSRHFMPHFHIPLQSGNNEILAAMRRRYRRELYASRVAHIRSVMPHAGIGVDVITGFPGETDTHFQDTWQFLEDLPVSYFHVFTYSERENTPAAEMGDVVPVQVRQERTRRLIQLSEKKKNIFWQQYVGTERSVLFEADVEQGILSGYSDNYIRVGVEYDPMLVNEIRNTEIIGLGTQGLMSGRVMRMAEAEHE
jgi:threonylcarbamoyladenosine tRNA methylthiotransferase MtaB